MAAPKISETVARILALAKPRYANNKWRRPYISRMQLSAIRRELIAQGEYWPRKPLRDRSADKPFKLKKWEREKPIRLAKIEENIKKMPEMIAEYRKQRAELREQTRKKKMKSEEDIYLIATGKKHTDAPQWQVFKDNKKK